MSSAGVATIANGTPDVSTHETYGEAYPRAGQSLNTELDHDPAKESGFYQVRVMN